MFSGGHTGKLQKGIFVRHFIKRRWEKLGIWNPHWGFAGRNLDASDDFSKWTWRWQPDGAKDGESPDHYARGLVLRALRLRQNLLRGECAPVMPRSHLEQDVVADVAEAFLISRPCFLFQIEVAEEEMRFARLSPSQETSYPSSTPRDEVIKWWKERGDWRDEFYRDTFYEKKFNPYVYRGREHGTVTSWKWRHESPSPEPESLTPIIELRHCERGIHAAKDMDFAPEEINELTNVFWRRDGRPVGTWTKYLTDRRPPLFPGQEKSSDLGPETLARALKSAFGKPFKRDPNLPRLPILDQIWEQEQDETSSEEQEELSDTEPDPVTPPPPKRRRLQHQQPEGETNEAQPRRSARVAGMKRSAESLPQEIAPNKRTRTRAAAKAAAPVTASSISPPSQQNCGIKAKLVSTQPQPPQEHTETQVKRGRGRPRKGSVPSVGPSTKKTPSAPSAPPASVGAKRMTASRAETSGTPRPRGRPRKGSGPGTYPITKNKAPPAPARARATRGTTTGTDVAGIRKRPGRPRKSK
ncbi:hypothetical protein F5Y10DRAFT_259102 [Nemania abortiva]|nr:hypothetical protein F5Y10DRAFT_259102 [Nemania abortiva]